ncbi:hypothetical protein EST38_g6351 [Candolleomyces aberdarensis]|uniref:Uncharacterized protein n=1 Tax=Candolleomyces aberdarensis TaxID=2316362 RepID=A0A4Q2DKT6_9AGAR|nr:hypothetical protein EST38_g6351 [Candolleomyces aberdarensis]
MSSVVPNTLAGVPVPKTPERNKTVSTIPTGPGTLSMFAEPKTPERKKNVSTIPTPPFTPKKRIRSTRPPVVRSKTEMRNRKMRDIERKLRVKSSLTKTAPWSPEPKLRDTGQPKPFPLASPLQLDSPPTQVDGLPDLIDLTKRDTPRTEKKVLPPNQSHYTEDAIEISSDTSGEAPDEKWYYGPSKSRVHATDPAGPSSPPRTRAWRKRAAQPVSSEDEKHETVHRRHLRNVSKKPASRTTRPLLKLNYDPSRKRKAGDAMGFDDVLRRHGPLVPRPEYVVPDLSDSASDLPEPVDVFRRTDPVTKSVDGGRPGDTLMESRSDAEESSTGSPRDVDEEDQACREDDQMSTSSLEVRQPKRRRLANRSFILSEASVEDDGDNSDNDDGGLFSDDHSMNDYDREDSFIDDSPGGAVPIYDVRRSRSLDRHASGDEDDAAMPSDEETQLEAAKLQSIFSKLRNHMSGKEYESSLRDVNRALRRMAAPKLKGKHRDREDDRDGMEQSSTLTIEEKEDIETAIANSLKDYRPQDQYRPPQTPGAGPSGGNTSLTASTSNVSFPPPTQQPSPTQQSTQVAATAAQSAAGSATVPPATPSSQSSGTALGPHTPAPAAFSMSALVAQTPGAIAGLQVDFPDNASFKPVSVVLPVADETLDPRLHDVFLANDYASLPNLPLALAGIRFQDSGAYINPSRAAPLNLQLRDVPAKSPRFHLMRNFKNLYCVTSGFVLRCHLRKPTKGGMRKKEIQLVPYQQEWERLVGFSCLVLDENPLGAQLWRDSIQMSTRTAVDSNTAGSSAIAVNPDPAPASGGDVFSLAAEDEVPIYDGRSVTNFNFDTDLPNLATLMPLWSGDELPFGSSAIAGYTMSKYMSNKGMWSVGCNIHWVILLGLPDEAVAKTLLGR